MNRLCRWWHGTGPSETGIPELDRLRRRDRRRNVGVVLLVGVVFFLVVFSLRQSDTIRDQNETIVGLVAAEIEQLDQHRVRNEVSHECGLRFDVAQQTWQQAQQQWTEAVVVAFEAFATAGKPPMLPPPVPPAPDEECPEFIDPRTGEPIPHE